MKKNEVIAEILDWAKYLAGAVVLALILNNTVVISAQVMSPSMESTMMTGSKILGNRLAYLFSNPKRNDIIVFKFPDNESADPYLKRIIGLPGETVDIKDGKVYINGSSAALDEGFINETMYGDYGPFVVPENSYFVMGDNRNNSEDSRFWNNKFVAKDKIIGKVLVEWFPSPHLLK
ncbi:MAG: signal peptidase I [Clostridiales bacterium]|nr:signal peptidase I [Clostridiales bacterium]